MTIYKFAWGVSLILIGLMLFGVAFPYLSQITGVMLMIAGAAFLFDK